MCGLGSSSKTTATTPAVVPEAAQLPTAPTGAGTSANDKKRRAAATGTSGNGTILTGSRGIEQIAGTATKTLLGQ